MQQSANHPLLDAVLSELQALEAACAESERALMTTNWEALEQSTADQRRLTHALQNAMFAALEVRDAAFDEQIAKRLNVIYLVRENQMQRMRAYQQQISKRLATIAKWKNASKTMLGGYKKNQRSMGSFDLSR